MSLSLRGELLDRLERILEEKEGYSPTQCKRWAVDYLDVFLDKLALDIYENHFKDSEKLMKGSKNGKQG